MNLFRRLKRMNHPEELMLDLDTYKFVSINQFCNNLNKEQLFYILNICDKYYHNAGKPLISDEEYDEMKDHYESRFEKIDDVGFKGKRDDVKLPYYMGSMNKIKIKDTNQLKSWTQKYKGPYQISDKLDGISAMFVKNKLYTRGNGTVGKNISNILDKLKYTLAPSSYSIRGELVISKQDFNDLVDKKILGFCKNPRNTVAGTINSLSPDERILKTIQFVPFEIVHPRITQSQEETILRNLFKNIVNFTIFHTISSTTSLDLYLLERKRLSNFDIDGIVCKDLSSIHEIPTDSNPKYAFAFKSTDQTFQTTVTSVEWNISKDLLLKPIIHFRPIVINGINISKCTGFNGKYIIENNIGPGALIEIARSGDVIPTIKNILEPSSQPMLPSFDHEFAPGSVDLIVTDSSDEVQSLIDLKRLQFFISKLKLSGVKDNTIKLLYENGAVRTIKDFFGLTEQKLKGINGFGDKKISTLITQIRDKKITMNILDLMEASNAFGRGFSKKKIKTFYDEFPNCLNVKPTMQDLERLKGFGNKSKTQMLTCLENFISFLSENDIQI